MPAPWTAVQGAVSEAAAAHGASQRFRGSWPRRTTMTSQSQCPV